MGVRHQNDSLLNSALLTGSLIGPGRLWRSVDISERTESTNADAAEAARAGAGEGTVLTTEFQTSGRGRVDRSWTFVQGASIAVSVVLRPKVPVASWVWLPLLTGLAVDATLRRHGVVGELKWPNDVQVGGRKIAGVLLERVETADGPAAVVGVGLNVSVTAEELPTPTATSLLVEGVASPDRTEVLVTLLAQLEDSYRTWVAADGDVASRVRVAYLQRCVTVGQDVRVQLPDGDELLGKAEGIDAQGRLVIEGRAISAGDVTHVRPIS